MPLQFRESTQRPRRLRSGARRVALLGARGLGAALLGWGAVAAVTWYRYGQPRGGGAVGRGARSRDALLDHFIPAYEVAEVHEVRVAAPASVTYAAAHDLDLQRSAIVRAIFGGRELLMGATGDGRERPRAFLPQALALGWRVLAEDAGRELVLGALAQPWRADVQFRGLSPAEFAPFDGPGYAKILWTLAAEPVGLAESVARTETRVVTTDAVSRARFRRYWAVFSPGIRLIRHEALRLVKDEAERRYRALGEAAVDS